MTPDRKPVAELPGSQLIPALAAYSGSEYYRSHSPLTTWQALRIDPDLSSLSDAALWDATAWIWRSSTTPESVARGAQLFAANCAACHGPNGRGDGVFADDLQAAGAAGTRSAMNAGTMFMQRPADLSDPARMLSASPALLQGKILRGGMGTGMPSWGPIFSDQQTWDLVSYLYTLQFDYPW
jgi:mono/diheme cytochrome c family protein